jgi:hypothetical protein
MRRSQYHDAVFLYYFFHHETGVIRILDRSRATRLYQIIHKLILLDRLTLEPIFNKHCSVGYHSKF